MKNSQHLRNSRAYVALCFIFLCTTLSKAAVPKDTIIYTNESSIDPLNRTSLSSDHFAYTTPKSWDILKRQLTIHILDLKSFEMSNVIVKIPTAIKILSCPNIALNDSFLLIQDDYDLNWFLFKLVISEYKLVEEIQFPPKTMALNVKVIDSKLFLFTDIYNHHPLDSVYNTSLAIYDSHKRKFIKVIHPEIPCIGLSHFPQHWITHNNKTIAIAEPCGNRIQLYDMNLNLSQIIALPKTSNWVDLAGNKIPIESSPALINPKEFIANFESSLTAFSRIQTIHFANDSLLLMTVDQPSTSTLLKVNFVYNTKSKTFAEANTVRISNSEYHSNCNDSLTFHIDPYLMLRDGLVISFEEDNYLPDPKISPEENEIRKNQFYETNDPEFIIRISKITLL